MNDKKKNVPMIVALSIPVLMIVFITVSIYVPALFIKPNYDFIYSVGRGYCHGYRYTVEYEKVIRKEHEIPATGCHATDILVLYYYDVSLNTSNEISFQEAQNFNVNNRRMSPDGFEIVGGGYGGDWFFFGGSSYYDRYLKKGSFSRKILSDRSYYYNFKLVGWIKEDHHG